MSAFRLLGVSLLSSAACVSGDFLAQFYAAHASVGAPRRERSGTRPSAKQMAAALDQPRLCLAAAFGLVIGPLSHDFRRVCARVTGGPRGNLFAAFAGLAAQQLLLTPLGLLAYFNAATAARGGFADPSFLLAHTDGCGAGSTRCDAMAVERRIVSEAMPAPLVASWAVFAPLALLDYYRAGGLSRAPYAAALFVPWAAYVSHTQFKVLL